MLNAPFFLEPVAVIYFNHKVRRPLELINRDIIHNPDVFLQFLGDVMRFISAQQVIIKTLFFFQVSDKILELEGQ
jgi:hypothetical protein